MFPSNRLSNSGFYPSRPRQTSGFTLVELLVVISIIGLLLAIITTTVMSVIAKARLAAINVEMQSIHLALEKVKLDFGSYPPSELVDTAENESAFSKYLQRRFPRYDVATRLVADMNREMQKIDPDYDYEGTVEYRPDRALVFWLVGFSGDPENPLLNHGDRMLGDLIGTPIYEFDKARLDEGSFAIAGSSSHQERKLIYVDYRKYADPDPLVTQGSEGSEEEFRVYHNGIDTTVDEYYQPNGYQIIYAGRDGRLGTGGGPTALNVPYSGYDADNMTSFSGAQTMFDFSDKN